MELLSYLSDKNVLAFFLLFARMSGLMVFFPFFMQTQIPANIKVILSLFLTIFLYPLAKVAPAVDNNAFIVIGLLSEVLFGLICGLILQLVFAILMMAGEQIAFVMGFTMANVMDPTTGTNMPVIASFLNLLCILTFLALDGHHMVLIFMSKSLGFIPLGGFMPGQNVFKYLNQGALNIFILGFSMAFPILAVSLLSDVIFGMLMKTMPQFNLLVIGYPIKIALGFAVLTAILLAMMETFEHMISKSFNDMYILFFS